MIVRGARGNSKGANGIDQEEQEEKTQRLSALSFASRLLDPMSLQGSRRNTHLGAQRERQEIPNPSHQQPSVRPFYKILKPTFSMIARVEQGEGGRKKEDRRGMEQEEEKRNKGNGSTEEQVTRGTQEETGQYGATQQQQRALADKRDKSRQVLQRAEWNREEELGRGKHKKAWADKKKENEAEQRARESTRLPNLIEGKN